MKKTRIFDDIKEGDLVRFLKNPTRGNGFNNHWCFGVVIFRFNTCFRVLPVGSFSYEQGVSIRYDGMNMPGKNALQIAFRLTPEEMDHPDIQGYLKKQEAIKQLKKQLIALQGNWKTKIPTCSANTRLKKYEDMLSRKEEACRAWNPIEGRDCPNCKYHNLLTKQYPCRECYPHEDARLWEPRKEASND